jgi:nitrogen-specific signal transduction histidine kinase
MTDYKADKEPGGLDNQDLQNNLQSDLCHELRKPLIGILGFSELLMEEKSVDDVTVMAEKINNCGTRLLQFIDKLLTTPVDGQFETDKNINPDMAYSEEELRIFRIELLNRFKKLAATGD